MPYRKKYARGRRFKRRRNRMSQCISYMGARAGTFIAKKALSGVQYLKGLVNSEKYKYTRTASDTVTNTGVIASLNNIPVGDTDVTRTGNSIYVRSLAFNALLTKNALASNTRVRVVFLIDNQQVSDTGPTWLDVYESTTITSFLNTSTVGRFTILKSTVYTLTDDRPTATIRYFKYMRRHIRFNGTSAGDVQKGGIWLMFISDLASNQPTMTWTSRVMYHDN